MTTRKQMRQNALAAAEHAYAIQRALAVSKDEAERQALVRFGPVPATCQKCHGCGAVINLGY